MICPKCGAEVAEGVKFCGNCGNPMDVDTGASQIPQQIPGQPTYAQPPQQAAYAQPPQSGQPYAYTQPPQKKSKTWLIILIIVLAIVLIIVGAIAWFVHSVRKATSSYLEDIENSYESLEDLDIDIEGLDDAIESMESLDFSDSLDSSESDFDLDTDTDAGSFDESSDVQSIAYSYVDVTIDGNDATIVPNGRLNGSTVFYGGKDLEGLLDYIDGEVLQTGRYINRDFFYDLLSTMLVDESAYSEFEDIESNMIMCLAMADNFYNIDVRVESCDLALDNAAEYNYNVKAEGRDDTWIINYGERTIYFNNGSTEYSSDMFKDEYLALWMMAVDDYYGYQQSY